MTEDLKLTDPVMWFIEHKYIWLVEKHPTGVSFNKLILEHISDSRLCVHLDAHQTPSFWISKYAFHKPSYYCFPDEVSARSYALLMGWV